MNPASWLQRACRRRLDPVDRSTCSFVGGREKGRVPRPIRISRFFLKLAMRGLRSFLGIKKYVSLLGSRRRCFGNQPDIRDPLSGLDKPRILITGSLGQLGQTLAHMLRQRYGREAVLMSDIVKPPRRLWKEHSPYLYIDVLDMQSLEAVVVNYQIDWLVHFSAVLSAVGEENVPLALRINVEGMHNVLEIAKQHALKVFVPSTIGAFGPSSPRIQTPDVTIQRPRTIYGVSKVHAELLGEYFNGKFGLDFRSLRFPGVISATKPGGGTTDYAVKIFHDALTVGQHECYLRPDTRLPMIYIDDCLRSVVEMLEAPDSCLSMRTYNVSAMSFTPEEITTAIQRLLPNFTTVYDICPVRQAIADSWPESLNDSGARRDWNWKHEFDLDRTVEVMLGLLNDEYRKLTKAPPPTTPVAQASSFP